MIYKMPIDGKWVQWSSKDEQAARKSGKKERIIKADYWKATYEAYCDNRIAHFLPHGVPWSDKERNYGNGAVILPPSKYPEKWKNDGCAFINDWESGLVALIGPNQNGKSSAGVAKTIFRIIPCNPEWPCFSNGIEFHDWMHPDHFEPQRWFIASYSWDTVEEALWKNLQHFLPRYELGRWAEDWGRTKEEKAIGKHIRTNFKDGKAKPIKLKCGSILVFGNYNQKVSQWTGKRFNGGTTDENPPEDHVDELIERVRTMADEEHNPQFYFMLTGEVVDKNPDTGAGGWFKRKIYDGRDTKGLSTAMYHLSYDSTPLALVCQSEKDKAYEKHVLNPKSTKPIDYPALWRGYAKYWGGFQPAGGLVFDEWMREIHTIDPLWEDDSIPEDGTKWRVIDFGDTAPTVCSWWYVSKHGWAVMYRLYYEANVRIRDAVPAIIRMSHNVQIEADPYYDDVGNVLKTYEEDFTGERYTRTLMDSRSCANKHNDERLEVIFQRYGLIVEATDGHTDLIQIPNLKEWLSIDWTKEHITRKNEDGTPFMGAPKLYIFNTCVEAIDEIEGLQKDPYDQRKINKKNPHHFIDTAKWWASEGPTYEGNYWINEKETRKRKRTPGTNY